MLDQLTALFPFVPVAMGLGLLGGALPVFHEPPETLRSYVQHFAAGLVTAVIAVDLLPEMRGYGEHTSMLVGFGVGALLMVALKEGARRLERVGHGDVPVGLATAAALDTVIDGVIIGAGFTVDAQLGMLLALGLGVELFALAMSVASEFRKCEISRGWTLAVVGGIALMLAVGAVLGLLVLEGQSDAALTLVLAFAAAALLYLVTEELLVKGHDAANTAATSAVFFLGFLALMAFTLWTGG